MLNGRYTVQSEHHCGDMGSLPRWWEALVCNMRIALLTLYTPEIEPVGRLSIPNKEAYCKRHGYDLIVRTSSLDKSRHPSWSKILLLLDSIERFDVLFWTDADSLIMNPDLRVEHLIRPGNDLVAAREITGVNRGRFNAGELIFSSTPRTKRFLEAVWAQTQFVEHPAWEQAAMNDLIEKGRTDIKILEVPKRTINADPRDYEPGDFILHYLGNRPRVYLMRKLIREKNEEGDPVIGWEGINAASRCGFKDHGLSLRFLAPSLIKYRQFNRAFVPGLSIIDVMMFNPPHVIHSMLGHFELVVKSEPPGGTDDMLSRVPRQR